MGGWGSQGGKLTGEVEEVVEWAVQVTWGKRPIKTPLGKGVPAFPVI